MFRKSILGSFVLVVGLASTQANAAFVHTDWQAEDDKKATLDTVTSPASKV